MVEKNGQGINPSKPTQQSNPTTKLSPPTQGASLLYTSSPHPAACSRGAAFILSILGQTRVLLLDTASQKGPGAVGENRSLKKGNRLPLVEGKPPERNNSWKSDGLKLGSVSPERLKARLTHRPQSSQPNFAANALQQIYQSQGRNKQNQVCWVLQIGS